MSTIGSYNSSSIQTLFSPLNKSGNSLLDLGTLSSIKNGSYGKLLKAYYSDGNNASKTRSFVESETSKNSTDKVNAQAVRDGAKALSEKALKLNDKELWQKKTDEETGKTGYDTDAIYKGVSDFVKSYNSVVSTSGDSNDDSVVKAAYNMVNNTRTNVAVLNKIGISVGVDNKLSIDEDAFKKADMSVVKSVMAGAGSFGGRVAASAGSISSSAASQLAKLSVSNNYNSAGAYSFSAGSTMNKYL